MRILIGSLFFTAAFVADAQAAPGLESITTGSNLGSLETQTVITIGGQQLQIIHHGSTEVFSVIPTNMRTGTTTLGIRYNGQTGTAGEYQLNVAIPAAVSTGDQFPLVATSGSSSDTVTSSIQ